MSMESDGVTLHPIIERKRERLRILAKAYKEAKEKGLVKTITVNTNKGD